MKGTRSLLKRLDEIKRAINTEVPNVIEQEVKNRSDIASAEFSTAQYDGVNDVVVTMDSQSVAGSHTWRINATGESVLFIEYGTGLRFKHDSEFGNANAYPPGSWSETHSRFLVEPKWTKWRDWWPIPGGGKTLGNPSANVMYGAYKDLRTGLKPKAKVTLGKAFK